MAEQQSLETRLHELEASARNKILKYSSVREGQAKDLEASLEQDFSGLRHVIRELESLAEDQEEEDEEEVVQRLQQYKRSLQQLQVDLSTAKLQPKGDSYEENRKQLLAGADPTQRQRELQTEADMVGAAQKTTSSLQRSRQVMLQQVENQQNILAAMDASHEQLAKTTDEYQGQSSVYGNTRQLLRTMKRHSSWDKLVLYGGFAMFMLVCLYIIQKRSVYFVPTFVKTGLGKLVPSWARLSSGRDVNQLIKPVKERQQGPEGLRQKPSLDTLRNADQAAELLQRHPVLDASHSQSDSGSQPVSGRASGPNADEFKSRQQPIPGRATGPDSDQLILQQAGGDAPHDSQAAFQAQAVDSAVAATDNIVQQLSDEEQERVRAAVASAAQQVAQQQQQQATLMATGQAYPQAQYGVLIEPQITSIPVDNSSHTFLSEASDTAELTAINTDGADELQDLDGLHQSNTKLEGSLPENISSSLELSHIKTTSAEQESDVQAATNASAIVRTAESSEASDITGTLQDSQALAEKVLQDSANKTAAFAPDSVTTDAFKLSESTEEAGAHQRVEQTEQYNPAQSIDPVTVTSTLNVTGDVQPQSSTGFSMHAHQSHQDDFNNGSEEGSTPAASTDSAESLSAAVLNQTLYEEEFAALTASVHNKSKHAPVLHAQAGEGRTYRQQQAADDSALSQGDADVQSGTPDRSVEQTMRESGHAEAFDHIMQSIPDFIRNADSANDVSGSSHGHDNDDDAETEFDKDADSPSDAQTNASSDTEVGNYAML